MLNKLKLLCMPIPCNCILLFQLRKIFLFANSHNKYVNSCTNSWDITTKELFNTTYKKINFSSPSLFSAVCDIWECGQLSDYSESCTDGDLLVWVLQSLRVRKCYLSSEVCEVSWGHHLQGKFNLYFCNVDDFTCHGHVR